MNLTNLRVIVILFVLLGAIVVGYFKTNLLNEVELVSGLGIDKVDDHYLITLQVYNPSANQKNAVDPTGGFTYVQTGKTVPDALMKIQKDTLKFAILDTLQIVALSERLVKEEGLDESLDFLIRDPKVPSHINTIIVKNYSPDVFLKIFTPQQKLSALYTKTMLDNSKSLWGSLVNTSSERIKSILKDETSDVAIPYVEILGDVEKGMSMENIEDFAPDTIIALKGFAAFKGEKFKSYLTYKESNVLALVKDVNQLTSISSECPDGDDEFSIETVKTSSKLKAMKDPVSYELNVNVHGNLEQNTCNGDLTSMDFQKKLAGQMEEKIKSDIHELIEKAKEEDTDFLGLKDSLYRRHPHIWEEKKKDDEFLSSAKVKINVNVNFIRFGHVKH
ncbi:Ger(x)C family spore germination protein [Rossellomorea aquimaris]|uniref:Ger(x)C family spore germination protein n=1 Tax=Rossellomorea aquimaris TaxID=189382 RepID=UPI001CD321BC|nr:Ger(x)C family spore germination protein [Rossellomorea aquimaris]MCA1054418.1 Ger(x)C family spore germination protein [Rossellomorea aquimaris]